MKLKWKKNKNKQLEMAAEENLDTSLVVEEYGQKKEKKVLTPEQKKKRKKKIIVGVIASCLVLFIVSRMFAPKALPIVSVRQAQIDTIEQMVDTSGTVQTEMKKTYFSPLTAKVEQCQVQAGDAVAAGDVLVAYVQEDLANREKEASLENDQAYYTYQDTVNKSAKDASEHSRSSHDIEILEQQVKDWKENVKATKQYITDLGCFLREAQSEGHDSEAEDLQSRIDQANNQLMVYEEELAEFESNLSEQKGIKNSTEESVLTDSGRKQVTATKDLAALKADKIKNAVANVQGGLKAEFGGVVTDVKAVNGSVIEEGGELLTVESNEQVCVQISLSKSDLEKVKEGQKAIVKIVNKEYEGTVTRVSKSAEKNEKGAAIVKGEVHIDNPDSDIFLGVEAKVTIQGHKAENVVTVPIEAVNVGKEGSFIYLLNSHNIVEKRDIETGISSAEVMEVKSGLEGGEKIILGMTAGISEGTQVTPMEE